MTEFRRHRGAGSRDGYMLRYPVGPRMLPLINEDGKIEVFSKTETHAAGYGKKNDAYKAYQAMTSTAWSRI